MIFVNLSSNYVQLFSNDFKYEFENRNFERKLPELLITIFKNKFYDKIFVLNWPWSFTTLRIWCLALNMLNFFYDNKIEFYSINKLDLYKKLLNLYDFPSKWIIYIWQKRNYWLYDFENNTYIVVNELNKYINSNIFVDYIVDDNIDKNFMVSFVLEKNLNIEINNNWFDLHKIFLSINPSKQLIPDYIISPNIS